MSRIISGLVACLGLYITCLRADLPPIPPYDPDPAQVAYLGRDLALLKSSSPSNRLDFRILFYGPSFSRGEWTDLVISNLQTMYPNVNFVVTNKSVSGLTGWHLSY